MASFFQPGSNDPAIADCPPGRFEVYCNSLISPERLLQTWYQKLNLILGAVAIFFPLLYVVIRLVVRLSTSRSLKFSRLRKRQTSDRGVHRTPTPNLAAFKSAKSFQIHEDSDGLSVHGDHGGYGFLTLPLTISHDINGSDTVSRSSHVPPSGIGAKMNLACVDLETFNPNALDETEISNTAQYLANLHSRTNLAGIALRCSAIKSTDQLNDILEILYYKGIPILLLCSHDSETWESLNFTNAAGVIVENACILPDGRRRDYFRARNLREVMARCSKEREDRPDFFIGYLDLWEKRPHPAVVRRSVKLAEHFGAVVEHGPVNPEAVLGGNIRSATQTLSGFEFLRRGAIIELQKFWSTEVRKVWIPNGSKATDVSLLPLEGLKAIIPDLLGHLKYKNLTPELEDIGNEKPMLLDPPRYADLAPSTGSFWDISTHGEKLSPKGCFPITTEATSAHFDAVVKTQQHLKELQMLQPLKSAEVAQLLIAYRRLVNSTECHYLVQSLIDGLETNQIGIYKGLDTGFGVPEGISHFWGVSRTRNEGTRPSFDIFVSLKAPNDATTILHTWLAHHGVLRVDRFELEHQFEVANGLDYKGVALPISMKTAIEGFSHAETLGLLQQIQVSGLNHFFREPLMSYCRTTLIEDASRFSWYYSVAEKTLSGAMDFKDLLQLRLDHFARGGATSLPTIGGLVQLYESVQNIVQDALFFGNRAPLNVMTNALLEAWDTETSSENYEYVDINADLFALIFFSVLRKAAFEEVYIEATDRCPFFLSQPDQAAVFSELWILGSQCEIYFGILPRALGEIVYNRYRAFLAASPPNAAARKGNEIMSMYSSAEPAPDSKDSKSHRDGSAGARMTSHEKLKVWKRRFTELGAISIFCVPAIIDVVLLTFVGRGVFMTAFMNPEHLQAAGLALLIALLLTAGVTGWVGSVGNYYLVNYAYDNMIYFHIQRLSGGFILTLLTAACGLIGYSVQYSVGIGFVFVGFLIAIAQYFNLLGALATMHQRGSPLTSGRTVLWRTIPFLLISPIISSFVNGYDLEIYLLVIYAFLLLLLLQYRRLCHEWSGWLVNIPMISEKDVLQWHKTRPASSANEEEEHILCNNEDPQEALDNAVRSYQRGIKGPAGSEKDEFVALVAHGMPYVDWLFKKTVPNGKVPAVFSASWFTQLGESLKQQKQLSRGLKEHNILILFRFARYDLGQNLGLFLVALMDRWVSIVMGAREPRPNIYVDSRARYGICLCILYFCASVMLLDATLQKYWGSRFKLSEEKLTSHEHAQAVAKGWERRRLMTLSKGLQDLLIKIMFVFGSCTILLWILVDNPESIILYYLYVNSYSMVILFQFNRCFTTNIRAHITIILSSAAIGFIVGCVLRAIPSTAGWLYCEVLAQNVAAVLAAIGTSLWTLKDWASPPQPNALDGSQDNEAEIFSQSRLSAQSNIDTKVPLSKAHNIKGRIVVDGDGSFVSHEVLELLRRSLKSPNEISSTAPWSGKLIQAAITMWTSRRITVAIASRQQFLNHDLEDLWSFSLLKHGVLEIVAGFLGEQELVKPTWQPLLASLIAESVLYHVARAELNLSHAKAIRSEHFLQETKLISQRLDFELAFEDEASIDRIRRKTAVELVKHLCLDVAVDAKWEFMPEVAREAVIQRITGGQICASQAFMKWTLDWKIDISTADFHVDLSLNIFRKVLERGQAIVPFSEVHSPSKLPAAALKPVKICRSRPARSLLQHWLRAPVVIPLTIVKWVAVISGAGSDIERELWYCLRDVYFHKPILWFLLFLWRICCRVKDLWIYALLIYGRPSLVAITRLAQKGARRKLKGSSIVVELPRKTITGFASIADSGAMILNVFDGIWKDAPLEKTPLFKATYDDKLRLCCREDGSSISTYNYAQNSQHKWPLSKEVSDGNFRTVVFYDKYGRINRGTMTIENKEFAFQYHYKATPPGNTDVLSGDFKLIEDESSNMFSVFWGASLQGKLNDYDWVPSDKICRLVKVIDGKTYVTEAEYRHRRDPLLTSFLEEDDGRKTAIAETPNVFEAEDMFLARPHSLSFDLDDLLVYHNKLQILQMRRRSIKKPSFFSYINPVNLLTWSGKLVYRPIPTWRIRTELWNEWLKADGLDAPTACWIDELVLREEPLLRGYWRARDSGRLRSATQALNKDIDQIASAIDIQTDVSEVCLLPIRTADLYTMGLGKDATQVTTRPEDCLNDTTDRISIIFNDIGCWPEAPGGVSNCRRDLVNGHSTIRNHVLAECANEFGIPRFQVEKNVNSMKLLPLWGLDGKSAHHGLIDNLLQSQVDEKIRDTDVQRDIVGVFIPLLKDFVKGARTKRYSRADLIKYSNVMLSMSKYYEHKDYSRTWESKEVEEAWVSAWLMEYKDPNITDPSKCFELERPSMSDFREVLGIYLAYFFIFSVKIPERCPRVFQSTHHGISSLFGMILRYRRNVTFGIWDHAILWRECCLNLSPAQSELPISVQSMLLSGIGLATRLAYFHADVIMPCTSLFNPMWEAEIGTDRGTLGSKRVFNRRIDPIVNGISDMESFTPVDIVRTDKPTVVMLSNVQFIKGIKTAILAADIIINRWGFKDYQLVVYGAKDRQPSYALEMAKLIVENNLSERVILAGFGKPKEVLKDAWLFMNSSISEGLPLAIGEAALAAVPIVATEVGATALVMTDPEDPEKRYGEVVPPNDPLALARAQLNILGMVGPWAKYTEEVQEDPTAASHATLPDEITPSDVEWLTSRMYEKAEDRRRLGLLSREVVLHSFHGNRYLREHEQMYWIQWHLSQMREDEELSAVAAKTFRFGTAPALRYVDEDEENDRERENERQDAFEDKSVERRGKKSNSGDESLSLVRWQDFSNEEEGKRLPKRLSKQQPQASLSAV